MAVKQSIQVLRQAIKEMKEQRKRNIQESEVEMKVRYNTLMRLVHMGILNLSDVDEYSIRWGLSRDIKREDLPRIRKAVGRVRVCHKELLMENNKISETHIKVTVCPVECYDVMLTYVKELHSGAKCKVTKIVIPAVPQREEFALVCDKGSQE